MSSHSSDPWEKSGEICLHHPYGLPMRLIARAGTPLIGWTCAAFLIPDLNGGAKELSVTILRDTFHCSTN